MLEMYGKFIGSVSTAMYSYILIVLLILIILVVLVVLVYTFFIKIAYHFYCIRQESYF